MDLCPLSEPLRYLVVANFLAAAKVRIDRVGDKGDYRAPALAHLDLLTDGGHVTQKSTDSAGLANRTRTWSRPPTHTISTDFVTVTRP
jgi:hypothetical protein